MNDILTLKLEEGVLLLVLHRRGDPEDEHVIADVTPKYGRFYPMIKDFKVEVGYGQEALESLRVQGGKRQDLDTLLVRQGIDGIKKLLKAKHESRKNK